MTTIGIFGGSFNPVHMAHLILAERALQERALDRVLFIPALQPPHKPQRPVAPAEHRMRMVELAVEANPAFEASRVEVERASPSYTLLTVRQLRESLGPAAELFLLLGADSVHDIPTWWRVQELVREVEIMAFERPGYSLEDDLQALAGLFGEAWARKMQEMKVRAPLIGISATEIRERVRAGKSVRYMVPEPVRQYILEHGLYAGS
jgi:nicotinate-nucleotide adenylyltransferase